MVVWMAVLGRVLHDLSFRSNDPDGGSADAVIGRQVPTSSNSCSRDSASNMYRKGTF